MRRIEVFIEKESGRPVEFFSNSTEFDAWLERENMVCVKWYDDHDYWYGEGRYWIAIVIKK